jgi:hypothetical protein
MIDLGELIPIVAILASACMLIAILHFNHERAKLKRGILDVGEGTRENGQLVRENEVLKLTVERLEDRIAVLERIATDPAERTSREIEQLR